MSILDVIKPIKYPIWKIGEIYLPNVIVEWNGFLYKCLAKHKSSYGLEPDITEEFWEKIGSAEIEDYIPLLIKPDNNSEYTIEYVNSDKFYFLWTVNDKVKQSYIEIYQTPELSSYDMLFSQYIDTYNSFIPYGKIKFEEDKYYYWRVMVYTDLGWSDWSEVFKFKVLKSNEDNDNESLGNYFEIIEDYEGGLYMIENGKSYKINYTDGIGEIIFNKYDLEEYDYVKRVNNIAVDIMGWAKVLDKYTKLTSNRAIQKVHNKLDNRKPLRVIELDFSFYGTLYGLEIDLEVFSSEQL